MNIDLEKCVDLIAGAIQWAFIVAMFSLASCNRYQSMPLTEQAIRSALTMPSLNRLKIRAEAIGHRFQQRVGFDLRDGLSPDEAAILAVLMNPILKVARDQQDIAEAQLLQAGILPNPTLSYSLETPVGGSTAGTVTAYGIGVSWNITSLISRTAKIDAATANNKDVKLSVAWQEWQIAQAARAAVYRLLVLNYQVELGSLFEQHLSKNLQDFRQAMSRGLVTELELAAAAASRNTAHNRVLSLVQKQVQQTLKLKQALGIPNDYPVELQADIKLPDHIETPPADRMSRDVEHQRLDILAFRQGYASQEAAVRTAVLEQFPKISIGPDYARDNGNVVGLGFGISINLPIFDRNQGKVAIARASRQQLFDEYISRIYQARANITQLAANIRSLNKLLRSMQSSIPQQSILVESYRRGVNLGQADVLSYYQAWNQLINFRIQRLSLSRRLIENRIALELATGLYCAEGTRQCFQ